MNLVTTGARRAAYGQARYLEGRTTVSTRNESGSWTSHGTGEVTGR